MSGRAAGLGTLVAFEARLAWRRLAGERRTLAVVLLAFFWAMLHFAAFHLMRGDGPRGLPAPVGGILSIFLLLGIAAMAFALAGVSLFERRDLDLVFTAPVPGRTVWAARGLALMAGVVATPAFFWLPFAHAGAWHGSWGLLAAYPALAAFAGGSVSVALVATLLLVRALGPRRARVLAQVLGALCGAAVFLVMQARSFLSLASRNEVESWARSPVGQWLVGESSPLWWPARAMKGDALVLAGLMAASTFAFAGAVLWAARAQASGALEVATAPSRRVSVAGARFRRSLGMSVLVKEWRLIARDPRAILHTLLPMLYLAPLLFAPMRRGEGAALVAPSVVVLAGFLAGGIAWLAASGEEASDLLGASPVTARALGSWKLAAACLPPLALVVPFVAVEAMRDAGAPIAFLACAAGSIAASAWVQAVTARPGARRDLARGAQPGRLATIVEHVGAAGWGVACWGAIARSPWGLAGLAAGVAAPAVAWMLRPREG